MASKSSPHKKLFVHRYTDKSKGIPYSRAKMPANEGPAERKVIAEEGLKKNPGSGKAAFPDALNQDDSPNGEIKSIHMKYKLDPELRNKSVVPVSLGRQPDFIRKIKQAIYGDRRLDFIGAERIFDKGLGKKFILTYLTPAQWAAFVREFFKSFLKAAGGHLYLASEEGYTVIDTSNCDRLDIACIQSNGAVRINVDRSCLPFI